MDVVLGAVAANAGPEELEDELASVPVTAPI